MRDGFLTTCLRITPFLQMTWVGFGDKSISHGKPYKMHIMLYIYLTGDRSDEMTLCDATRRPRVMY